MQAPSAFEKIKIVLKRLQEVIFPARCKKLYITFAIAILVITTYFVIMQFVLKKKIETFDFMNETAFTINGQPYSLWPISHLVFFFFLGFFFPTCTIPAIVGGVLWEVAELIFGQIYSMNRAKVEEDGTVQYNVWWVASFSDIIFNILGFFLGKIARIEIDVLTNGHSESCLYPS